MKTLLLAYNKPGQKNLLLERISSYEMIDAVPIFRFRNRFLGRLSRLCVRYWPSAMEPWLGSWVKNLDAYDQCVCFAGRYTPGILEFLKDRCQDLRLIEYYWDKISISKYPIVKSPAYENWTFDKSDAQQYHMHYNPQFYVNNIELDHVDLDYDVCFIGADREGTWPQRVTLVNQCYEAFRKEGLKCFFYLVSESAFANPSITHRTRLTEEQYLKQVARSRALLEVVQPGQEWLTLRPLLAMFNSKKLITNNPYIVDEKFYSSENVFVLGVDSLSTLPSFIESPFVPIKQDILDFYNVDSWCNRFYETSASDQDNSASYIS